MLSLHQGRQQSTNIDERPQTRGRRQQLCDSIKDAAIDEVEKGTRVENFLQWAVGAFAASKSAMDRPRMLDARPIESSPARIRSTAEASSA